MDAQIEIKVGKITDCNTDVVVTWSFIDLKNGPEPFADVVKKAGDQTYFTLYAYKDYARFCDSLEIMSGNFGAANTIIFSITPDIPERYSDSFYNIANSLKTYGVKNNCRFVDLTIPDYNHLNKVVHYLYVYFKEIQTLRKITIHCNTEEQKQRVEQEFKRVMASDRKVSIFKRIKAKLLGK